MNRRDRKKYIKLMIKDNKAPISAIFPAQEKPYHRKYDVSRNDLCPCGSEIKFKKCCLTKGKYDEYETK